VPYPLPLCAPIALIPYIVFRTRHGPLVAPYFQLRHSQLHRPATGNINQSLPVSTNIPAPLLCLFFPRGYGFQMHPFYGAMTIRRQDRARTGLRVQYEWCFMIGVCSNLVYASPVYIRVAVAVQPSMRVQVPASRSVLHRCRISGLILLYCKKPTWIWLSLGACFRVPTCSTRLLVWASSQPAVPEVNAQNPDVG
jgi:hypothetical protein